MLNELTSTNSYAVFRPCLKKALRIEVLFQWVSVWWILAQRASSPFKKRAILGFDSQSLICNGALSSELSLRR